MSHWNGPSDCNPNKQTAGDAYVMWCVASLLFLFSFMICNKAKKRFQRSSAVKQNLSLIAKSRVLIVSETLAFGNRELSFAHLVFNSLQQPFLLSTLSLLCCDKNVCKIVSRSPKFSFGLTSALFSRIKGGTLHVLTSHFTHTTEMGFPLAALSNLHETACP